MPSTMTLSYLVFPSGTPVPGTEPPVPISVPDGSPQTLSAWDQLTVAAPPGDPSSYTFAFWAVPGMVQPTQFTNGVPDPQQVITFQGPSDESFNATAWYVPDGGDGPPAALAWAFSLNKNTPIPTATLTSTPPFASVSPPGCVEGPNTVSTTDPAAIAAGDVTITAANLIEGSGRFQQWLQFFGNGNVTS